MDDEARAQYCTCVVGSCYGYVNHGFQSKLHPLFDIHEGLRRDDGARGNTFFHSGLRRLVEAKGALHFLCLHFGDLSLQAHSPTIEFAVLATGDIEGDRLLEHLPALELGVVRSTASKDEDVSLKAAARVPKSALEIRLFVIRFELFPDLVD